MGHMSLSTVPSSSLRTPTAAAGVVVVAVAAAAVDIAVKVGCRDAMVMERKQELVGSVAISSVGQVDNF